MTWAFLKRGEWDLNPRNPEAQRFSSSPVAVSLRILTSREIQRDLPFRADRPGRRDVLYRLVLRSALTNPLTKDGVRSARDSFDSRAAPTVASGTQRIWAPSLVVGLLPAHRRLRTFGRHRNIHASRRFVSGGGGVEEIAESLYRGL